VNHPLAAQLMALVAPARTVEVVIELMDPGTCMCERCVAQRQREGSNQGSWETASNPDGEEGEGEGEEEGEEGESGGDDSDYDDEEDDEDGDGRSSFESASEGGRA
jgi:hypothetical protein